MLQEQQKSSPRTAGSCKNITILLNPLVQETHIWACFYRTNLLAITKASSMKHFATPEKNIGKCFRHKAIVS